MTAMNKELDKKRMYIQEYYATDFWKNEGLSFEDFYEMRLANEEWEKWADQRDYNTL